MKDRIVKMVSVLWALIRPPENDHHAIYRHTVSPSQARDLCQTIRSPWLDPWPGPSSESARQLWADDERDMTIPLTPIVGDLRRARFEYRRSFDRTAYGDELDPHQERQKALSSAANGFDYPYEYPGAPFPASTIGAM